MANNLNTDGYEQDGAQDKALPGWWKMGAIAAASGILGGLAAAWYYRKTLAQLRTEDRIAGGNPVSGNPDDQDYDI